MTGVFILELAVGMGKEEGAYLAANDCSWEIQSEQKSNPGLTADLSHEIKNWPSLGSSRVRASKMV